MNSRMDSSDQLANVFTDDYKLFESSHHLYPDPAAVVFGCVSDLRVALNAFREATRVSAGLVEVEQTFPPEPTDVVEASEELVHSDSASPAVLLSSGSMETSDL